MKNRTLMIAGVILLLAIAVAAGVWFVIETGGMGPGPSGPTG